MVTELDQTSIDVARRCFLSKEPPCGDFRAMAFEKRFYGVLARKNSPRYSNALTLDSYLKANHVQVVLVEESILQLAV